MVLSQLVGRTLWVLFPFIWENFIRDTHFDVICLAGEQEQRLVLRLPSEASDSTVVAGCIHMSTYAEQALQSRGVRTQIVLDGGVCDAFD